MALEVYIRGFLKLHKAHCKGKYKDIMLVAMSINANKQVYPVAFGQLSDKENDESWSWFTRRL